MFKFSECLSAPAAVIAAGVFACFSAVGVAAESTVGAASAATAKPIEQIVVVAHKDKRSVREIATNVTVLSRADLNNELATSINDVFRYVPGVDYEAAGNRFEIGRAHV